MLKTKTKLCSSLLFCDQFKPKSHLKLIKNTFSEGEQFPLKGVCHLSMISHFIFPMIRSFCFHIGIQKQLKKGL